tara:strand:+ start:22441 stop:23847 length:1407 start_codon:yes stop_codon:yes gene_type:complete
MNDNANKLLPFSILILEFVLVYVLISVLSIISGHEESLIGWVQIALMITSAYLVSATINAYRLPSHIARCFMGVVGMMAIYVFIGSHIGANHTNIDLAWVVYFLSHDHPEGFSKFVVGGGFVGAALWYLGAEIAFSEDIIDKLNFSFRIGLLILGASVIVDLFTASHMYVIEFMALFFFAALAGFCMSNISSSSVSQSGQRPWLFTFGFITAGLLAVGLIMAGFEKFILSLLVGPILKAIGFATSIVFYIVVWPLAYLLGFLVQGVVKLFSLLGGETDFDVDSLGEFGQQVEQRREIETASSPGYLAYFEWVLLACLLVLLLIFLFRAFRKRFGLQDRKTYEFRESLSGQRLPLSDMYTLLKGLLPERLKNRGSKVMYSIPDGDPLLTEIFRLYYKLLSIAEEKGFGRKLWETPNEYKSKLARIFPADISEKATKAFNKACYGSRTSSTEVIQDMESYLNNISSEEQK